jgi:hypothetical protein
VDGKAPAGDVAGQPGTEGVLSIQVSWFKNKIKKKKQKTMGTRWAGSRTCMANSSLACRPS